MSERASRESTGYTEDMQRELDGLIEKMKAGITLSEGEKERANRLAIAEKQYSTQLEIAKLNQQKYAATPGGVIYNTSTGQISTSDSGW